MGQLGIIETSPYVRFITHCCVWRPEQVVDVKTDSSEPLDEGRRDLTMSPQLDFEQDLSRHFEESVSEVRIGKDAIEGGLRYLRHVK